MVAVTGTAGDDTLSGGNADDVISGGAGYDIATFSGKAENYEFAEVEGALLVRDLRPASMGDGSDTLYGVELLQFEDRHYGIDHAEVRANAATDGSQYSPSVTVLAAGRIVVAWNADGQAANDTGGFGQLFDASGFPIGTEFRIGPYSSGCPKVTALTDGGFAVAWSGNGISVQLYEASGRPAGGEISVGLTQNRAVSPAVVAKLSDGGFVVAWSYIEFLDNFPHFTNVYAQRYARDGTPIGLEFRVDASDAEDRGGIAVTGLEDGGFAIAWVSGYHFGSDRTDDDIFVRVFDSAGDSVSAAIQVNLPSLNFHAPGLA